MSTLRTGTQSGRPAGHERSPLVTSDAKAHLALCGIIWSLGPILTFSNGALFTSLVVRTLQSESIVQFIRGFVVLSMSQHVVLTVTFFTTLCWMYPVDMGEDGLQLSLALLVLPWCVFNFLTSSIKSELELRVSRMYWTFSFEAPADATAMTSRRNIQSYDRFARRSPLTVLVLLMATRKMVQAVEALGGLSDNDKLLLSQARDNFVAACNRPHCSLYHRSVATEAFAGSVASLLARQSTSHIVRPRGPIHKAVARIEGRFVDRAFHHAEVLLTPLPPPFDPDNPVKLVVLVAVLLLGHKKFFQKAKTFYDGDLPGSVQVAKYASRFVILLYLTCRFVMNRYREYFGRYNNKRKRLPVG